MGLDVREEGAPTDPSSPPLPVMASSAPTSAASAAPCAWSPSGAMMPTRARGMLVGGGGK